MEIRTLYLKTQKTARYSTFGNLSKKTKYFWFALHGSKMLCEQMLYKFSEFDPDEHFIVAPEGLNRFYADGFGGDVVSSWMTKRDRLPEIEDFCIYLSTLYQTFLAQLPPQTTKIILGFSQGGTTMFRWAKAKDLNVDVMLAYSCWIPEDIDLQKLSMQMTPSRILYTYGMQDQFLNEDIINQVKTIGSKNKLNIKYLPYEGEHKVDKMNLKNIFEEHIIS